MLLFHKRTKKAIKYIWGFISVLIVLSMVVTYSGFTMLARTPAPVPQELSPEDIDLLNSGQQGTSPEVQELIDSATASNTLELAPANTQNTAPAVSPTPAPTAPPLNLSL
jgi:hypothetical protein